MCGERESNSRSCPMILTWAVDFQVGMTLPVSLLRMCPPKVNILRFGGLCMPHLLESFKLIYTNALPDELLRLVNSFGGGGGT